MPILKHELRQGRLSFAIWTGSIGALLVVCICLFPEIRAEAQKTSQLFASMGSFTAAFGMDRLDFGTLPGFYAVECGNIIGLGGALFAALIGITALSKEEHGHTAEFLLTHPISRSRVFAEKLGAAAAEVLGMNVILLALSLAAIVAIREEIPWREVLTLHLAYLLLHLELAGIGFGLSAFLRSSGTGIGLGLAAVLYFLELIANMTDAADFLRFVTPFAYCSGADIVAEGRLELSLAALGALYTAALLLAGYRRYRYKDIR